MTVEFKKLSDEAVVPTRGSQNSAGYDLYALLESDSVEIAPHTTLTIGTGLSFALPDGYFGAIFARSGLATKEGLRPANCVGVADSDYRGEYKVALHNDTDFPKTVNNKERIAQLIIMPYQAVTFLQKDELSETERGTGGFGSTGK